MTQHGQVEFQGQQEKKKKKKEKSDKWGKRELKQHTNPTSILKTSRLAALGNPEYTPNSYLRTIFL